MKTNRVNYLLLGATWLVGLAAIPFLPQQVPIHWNVAGQVDNYGSPLFAGLFAPAISTAMVLLWPWLPRLDPRGASYAGFERSYSAILSALLVFFLGLHLVTLGFALGLPLDVPRLVVAGVGLLLAVLGLAMRSVQQNYFVGIRTPWTLADPEVWRRTHDVGGWAFALLGAVMLLAALFFPLPLLFPVVLVGVLGVTLFSLGYSYWLWRRLRASIS